MQILFVCTGNICRSPFAEHLTRKLALEAGLDQVRVSSAGTHAQEGRACPQQAIEVGSEFEVDLTTHLSVRVEVELLTLADLVLVMTPDQVLFLEALLPDASGTVIRCLAEFSPGPRRPPSVPDPYGSETWAFRASYQFIEACVRGLLKYLA